MKVTTRSDTQPIGSLPVGDSVTGYNPTTGKAEAELIQHVWRNHDAGLVDVRVVPAGTTAASATATTVVAQTHSGHGLLVGDDATSAVHLVITHESISAGPGETIHTTANHPWLTADRGWVQAGDLKPGEAVVTLDGATSTVAWVQVVPGQADMYNLTVAHDHIYAVGDGQWVVHNANFCTWGSDRPQIDSHVFNKHAQSNPSTSVTLERFPNDNPDDIQRIIYSAWDNRQPLGAWRSHDKGMTPGGIDTSWTDYHKW